MIHMKPAGTIAQFDAYLARRSLRLEAVVIGGAALGLLGVVSRQTDVDILYPALQREILDAARDFAKLHKAAGDPLSEDWLNNGPASLTADLPKGWKDRLQIAYQGKVIVLRSPGRVDLLCSKLFSLWDRGIDLPDCIALRPTKTELDAIVPWLEEQDANPDWSAHVRVTFDDLRRRLGHAV